MPTMKQKLGPNQARAVGVCIAGDSDPPRFFLRPTMTTRRRRALPLGSRNPALLIRGEEHRYGSAKRPGYGAFFHPFCGPSAAGVAVRELAPR